MTALPQRADRVWVTAGDLRQAYDTVVVCGGLGTDRLDRAARLPSQERIVPFRGEYYRLRPWPGFWALAARHWRAGMREMVGSLSKRVFAGLARRYVPALSARDLIRAPAGVRAQALDRSGGLVDDFRIHVSDRIVLVRNAPSPAAAASLAIAEYIVDRVPS